MSFQAAADEEGKENDREEEKPDFSEVSYDKILLLSHPRAVLELSWRQPASLDGFDRNVLMTTCR